MSSQPLLNRMISKAPCVSINTVTTSHTMRSPTKACNLCQQDHPLFMCPQFKRLEINKRKDHARKLHVCFNCLSSFHAVKQCPSERRCRTCSGKHHSLLHGSAGATALVQTAASDSSKMDATPGTGTYSNAGATSNESNGITTLSVLMGETTLLTTAVVVLQSPKGHSGHCWTQERKPAS